MLRGQSMQQVQLDVQRGAIRSDATKAAAADPQRPYAHPYYWAPFVLSGSWL
jgi:CHAT domain-containing protein